MSIKSAVSLWDFALTVYAKQNVETACLQLQDEYGFDIPLLLFCCWSGWRYGAVSEAQLQAVISFSGECSQQSVVPLRHIRRLMKIRYSDTWPVLESAWEDLRSQVKTAELLAEQLLLDGLEQLTQQWQPASDKGNDACLHTIKACFIDIDLTDRRLQQQLVTLLAVTESALS